jgi:uncharacterized protein (TIGR02145 family)
MEPVIATIVPMKIKKMENKSYLKSIFFCAILLVFTNASFSQKVDKKCQALAEELKQKDSILSKMTLKLDSIDQENKALGKLNGDLNTKLSALNREAQLIKIGAQQWDNSNLKVTSLNDGTPIFYADTRVKWDSLFQIGEPAYCMHKNDSIGKFGFLYNYFAIESGKLAPEGMRIPSKMDIEQLNKNLNWENSKGAVLLKSSDTAAFELPVWTKKGLDVYKMGIRPLGFRLDDGKEWYFGNKIYYWCETDKTSNKLVYLVITDFNETPFTMEKELGQQNNNYGLYVRCIK